MFDAEVDPPAQLALVAQTLRSMGDKELSRELYRGLNRATTKLKADARAEAGRRLPRRGGLAQRVAGARLSTVRRGGGVAIRATGMGQLALMDAGQVRHPVFGRGAWVVQNVTSGWFSDPMEAGADETRREVEQVLVDVAVQIARRLDSPGIG